MTDFAVVLDRIHCQVGHRLARDGVDILIVEIRRIIDLGSREVDHQAENPDHPEAARILAVADQL